MANYKKKDKTAKQLIKDQHAVNASHSTTEEVFEGLDTGANKIEKWILKRQNYLLGAIGGIAILVLGYFAFLKYVKGPNEKNAADELAYPRAYFEEGLSMQENQDSLFNMALNGGEGKQGLLDIVDQYGNTKAGNLAKYYTGIAYLKMSDFKKAIEYLDDFKTEDLMLGSIAKGAIGDAFSDLNKPQDAFDYYTAAYQLNENNFTSPMFMDKAAKTAIMLKNYDKAIELYTNIKEKYPQSQAAQDIDMKINLAKYAK